MLYDIIERSAIAAIKFQKPDGSMPPGHNGPYNDPETPVRNTAHWLITFLKVHELTNEKVFILAAQRAIKYLNSLNANPMGAAFYVRNDPEKDFSNGLIGQAWVMEALITAGKYLAREDLLELSKKTFLLHPYDKMRGGWRVVNVDGSYGKLDFAFNHQLWFAAVGSMINLSTGSKIDLTILDFLGRLEGHLHIYKTGLIKHLPPFFLRPTFSSRLRGLLSKLTFEKSPVYMKMKSVGYHAFNLYAFALLYSAYPFHSLWGMKKFKKVLTYAKSEHFLKSIFDSKYGYPYNPPGFEIPFAFQVFNYGTAKEKKRWIDSQLIYCFDTNRDLLCRNTEDPNTLAARLYEATRLDNYPVELSC